MSVRSFFGARYVKGPNRATPRRIRVFTCQTCDGPIVVQCKCDRSEAT